MTIEPLSDDADADIVGATIEFDTIVEFDNGISSTEGWGIFECSGSANGIYQLCRSDEEAIFPDDEAAWKHVVAKVAEGSAYHRSALDYIRANNAIEWASFGNVHGEPLSHINGSPMLDADGALIDVEGKRILSDGRPLMFNAAGGPMRDTPPAAASLDKLISIHNEKGLLSIETEDGKPVAVSAEQFPIADLRRIFGQFAAAQGMDKAVRNALQILEPAAMVAESHGANATASALRETLVELKASLATTGA
jgi:hypothetical protein